MRFLSKISIVFFFFFFSLFLLVFPSFAQEKTTQTNNFAITNTNSNVPNNLHNWTQSVMIEVMSSLTCQLIGIDPTTSNKQCLGVDQKTGKIGFLPAGNLEKGQIGGAVGGMNNMISMLYTPPLHTSDYFQNLAQDFGITKKTYAQNTGIGFQGLSPLMNTWTTFRNIVYLFLVIVFVVIGLAIMLRVKIDPRTVMTVQNQIPKIIVGILLVTFSFAIAGFLVDLMWIFNYLIINALSGSAGILQGSPFDAVVASFGSFFNIVAPVASGASEVVQKLLGISPTTPNFIPFISTLSGAPNFFADPNGFINAILTHPENIIRFTAPDIFIDYAHSPADIIINAISYASSITAGYKIFQAAPIKLIVGWTGGANVTADLGVIINAILAGTASAAVFNLVEGFLRTGLTWIIVYVIVSIALLVALFRLWFALIMAYVMILIDVVLAPFWIIGGILPGSPISFSGWLKDIGANLLAFPATIFMFLIGKVFMDGFAQTTNPFAPPLIGDLGNPEMFSSLIGIGIILMTPNVVSMLKTALKTPKMNTGIGAAITAGTAVPMSGARSIGAYYAKVPKIDTKGGITAVMRNIFKF